MYRAPSTFPNNATVKRIMYTRCFYQSINTNLLNNLHLNVLAMLLLILMISISQRRQHYYNNRDSAQYFT